MTDKFIDTYTQKQIHTDRHIYRHKHINNTIHGHIDTKQMKTITH